MKWARCQAQVKDRTHPYAYIGLRSFHFVPRTAYATRGRSRVPRDAGHSPERPQVAHVRQDGGHTTLQRF